MTNLTQCFQKLLLTNWEETKIRRHFFASVPAVAEEQKMVTELTAVLMGKKGGSLEMIVRQLSTYPGKICLCTRVKLFSQCSILYMCVITACQQTCISLTFYKRDSLYSWGGEKPWM